ncbi:TPA: AbrB/MazE/SpoVT family DNA-binding domain-containing protein [Candidatus Latescibacteria bacterium]|nr:AbrB/MazE/SpoVT family DNA-binding domain-containing protein [Candidatus Latescibacterota bacterium]
METAKVFTNGRSQAVRLPKSCRFEGKEVYIKKLMGAVVLVPKADSWKSLVDSLDQFSPDFMEERAEPGRQKRMEM